MNGKYLDRLYPSLTNTTLCKCAQALHEYRAGETPSPIGPMSQLSYFNIKLEVKFTVHLMLKSSVRNQHNFSTDLKKIYATGTR